MTALRHILVVLCLLGCIGRPAVGGPHGTGATGAAYAINLASSPERFSPDEVPALDALHARRVYVALFRQDGRTWHRLRVGFFDSLADARDAQVGLQTHYPDAWIAQVSAAEQRDSVRTVLDAPGPAAAAAQPAGESPVAAAPAPDSPDETPAAAAGTLPVAGKTAGTGAGKEATAAADWLSLAGAEYGSDNAYYYAGLLVPFPGSDLGNGFVQRYWVDWLEYEYDNSADTIRARAPGASVALGYGQAASAGAWSAYIGAVWRDTDLSPNDPGSDVRGAQWGVNIGLQGDRRLGDDWRVNGIAGFTTGTDSYWTRGRLTRRLAAGFSPGLEVVLHGNDDYSAWQAGIVVLDIRLSARTLLGLKGGARKTEDEATGAYAGIELAHSF